MICDYDNFMRSERESVFTGIYRNKTWGIGTESSPLSGSGSNPDYARSYVNFVSTVISEFGFTSVLDVGHGDWAMWRDYKFENVEYIGVDVAQDISALCQEKFGNETRSFLQIAMSDNLPPADLLICKDVLQHLSSQDIGVLFRKFENFEYVILCNDIHGSIPVWRLMRFKFQLRTRLRKLMRFKNPFYSAFFPHNNLEINSGEYRGLDLEKDPFGHLLRNFEILERIEFTGGHPEGTRNRILFLRKLRN